MIKRLLSHLRKRRLYKACPELRHFDVAEQEQARRHGKVSDIQEARKAYMTSVLKGR